MDRALLGSYLPPCLLMQTFASIPALQPFEHRPVLYAVNDKSLTSTDTGACACSPPVHIIPNVAGATSQECGGASILIW